MPDTEQSAGTLKGLRVIDLSRVLAGPLCTQYLADHGAEVIKIEPPGGDELRLWGPFGPNGSAFYSSTNRNKETAALDLSKQEGREVLLRLLETADILVHNFKPGTLERWGIGYDQLLGERFPRLICCEISGFGGDGPLGGYPGYDSVVQAVAGLMSVNGPEDRGPTRVGMSIVDTASAYNALSAILMALFERTASGKGQRIDIALYDVALNFLHPHAVSILQTGTPPRRTGNYHPSIAPYEMVETGEGPLFLGIGNDGQFRIACEILGCPELPLDERFSTNVARVNNREELRDLLAPILKTRKAGELSDALLARGVPATPVLDVEQALAAPHTAHRDMVVELPGYKALGIPIKFSRTPGTVRFAPQALGASSREICRKAGFSEAEIDDMIARGIVIEPVPEAQDETGGG